MNKIVLLVLLLGFFQQLYAQSDSYDSGGIVPLEQAAYDIHFYDLNLTIHPQEKTIEGSNHIFASALNVLTDFVVDFEERFIIDSVLVYETNQSFYKTNFSRKKTKIWVALKKKIIKGDPIHIAIYYRGQPREAPNSPWNGGFDWKKTASGQPWISVSCQLEGADIWWPCKDYPSDEPDSMALNFTVPEDLVCVSNGSLRNVITNPNGTITYGWFVSTPINNYGVTFYLAPYKEEKIPFTCVTGEQFPVSFWYLPENFQKHENIIKQIPQHLHFLEERLGPYPFRCDKYAVVEAPYLGMEHQSCIAYGNKAGNGVFGYDYGFDALHFHELCHEWWGNMLTASDWKDFWLHEGFASYMEALYAEHLAGLDGYFGVMEHFRIRIANLTPVAPRTSQTTDLMYSGDIYYKGAYILHTLRYFMGEDCFFDSLQRFLYPDSTLKFTNNKNLYRHVSTDEYKQVLESTLGQKLDWFFEIYLRRASLPLLHVRFENNSVHLRWDTEDSVPFPMPVPIHFGSRQERVDMSSGEANIMLEQDAAPQIDPDSWILKKIVYADQSVNRNNTPARYFLEQNYPNPFNEQTNIRFGLKSTSHVNLIIYNMRGEKIETLISSAYPAGDFTVSWDGKNNGSGTYIYKIEAGEFAQSKKMILIR